MPYTRFVTNNNVDHFIALLEMAENDEDRSRFQKLLVAEEDRFAEIEHRRDALDRCLAMASVKISRQSELMDEMRARGHDLKQAEGLMANLLLVQATLTDIKNNLD